MRVKYFCLLALASLLAFGTHTSGGQEKPRVFVEGTASRAETTEHLAKNCREVTVTSDKDRADYVFVRDDTGAGPGRRPHKVTVYNSQGDAIFAGSTRTVGNAIKDGCKAIVKDMKKEKS